jgi:hypothetical protein
MKDQNLNYNVQSATATEIFLESSSFTVDIDCHFIVGVGEVKDFFWYYFTNGKQFAKRQSAWDVMFIMGIQSMARCR